MKKQDMMS